ncbi:MAG TPA: hypothetical protein VNW94_26240 [Streptosporangiaceae bacterium]|nr:hypothetical protein [Streptosporangiaceae bacterium]
MDDLGAGPIRWLFSIAAVPGMAMKGVVSLHVPASGRSLWSGAGIRSTAFGCRERVAAVREITVDGTCPPFRIGLRQYRQTLDQILAL